MELQGLKQQEKAAKEELEKPFAQEVELAEKRMRLAQLNSELNIDDMLKRGRFMRHTVW